MPTISMTISQKVYLMFKFKLIKKIFPDVTKKKNGIFDLTQTFYDELKNAVSRVAKLFIANII
jgi:hypothetical protein